jgi:hypothetical protein
VDHCTLSHNGYGANYTRNQQGEDGMNFGGGSGSLINENRFSSNRGFGLQVFTGSGSITENASYANELGQYAIYGSWEQNYPSVAPWNLHVSQLPFCHACS